ncbi:Ran BP2/NZF zinc finger-like superfamily protein [Perilla frutescens var. frutescens]|nr:Ran BP2/NZF zinc finger-like superfamily protein [Perilla frutescens var. frutescens]
MSCRQGDWMCGACQHLNFTKRESCQRCGCPKYGDAGAYANAMAMQKTAADVLAGDWYCGAINCGAHNYASRTSCYRCCASKDYCGYGAGIMASAGYAYDAIHGWKTGDWICSRVGCGMHNYASRMECYKCQTPKDYGGAM